MKSDPLFLEHLRAALKQSTLLESPELSRLNTWKLGGTALALLNAECEEDICTTTQNCLLDGVPWRVIGKGSNLLMPEFWPGVLIRLGKNFRRLEMVGQDSLATFGAGMADATAAQKLSLKGWSGLEFLIGIPGTIGGAVCMNAGAHGSETSDYLKSVDWLDEKGIWRRSIRDELNFAYRSSPFNSNEKRVVLKARFSLVQKNPEEVRQKMMKFHTFRIDNQPQKQPNCGSVFRNPPNGIAAKLIEASGLKGKRFGGMQISQKHSNFMVNLGGATSDDAVKLIEFVKDRIWVDHKIELRTEVHTLA
jgi:UDP-N-acetylmuramate dehydrogenase